MRQNVPARKEAAQAEAGGARPKPSIDEWLEAALAEQGRRPGSQGPSAAPEQGSAQASAEARQPTAELDDLRPALPAEGPSADPQSSSSWIERAQEQLAEVASGRREFDSAGTQTGREGARSSAASPQGFDALTAVESLDPSYGVTDQARDARAAQEEAFRTLENRIREIAGRLDTPKPPARPKPRELESAVAEIRAHQARLDQARLDQASGPAHGGAPSRLADDFATASPPRSERTRPAAQSEAAAPPAIPSGLEWLRRDIDRVQGSIAGLATRTDLGAVERSIAALASEMAETRASGGSTAPVAAGLETLQAEMERLIGGARAPAEELGRISRDIDVVSHKLDIVAASGLDPSALDQLNREVAEIRRMLGDLAAPTDLGSLNEQLNELRLELARIGSRQVDAQDFTSLRVAFEEMRDALAFPREGSGSPDAAVSAAAIQQVTRGELQPIASMLVMLIEKIERLERHSGDPDILDQIERQIAGVTAAISSSAMHNPGLSALEQAMADLLGEVSTWRDGTIEIAERAARNAVAETLGAMGSQGRAEPNMPSDSTDRAADPEPDADVVQSRLEDVVRNVSGIAARKVDPATASAPQSGRKPRQEPDLSSVPVPQEDSSDVALRRLNEAILRNPPVPEADQPLPRAPEDEILLEPGTERPRSGAPLAEPGQDGDPRDIKASFIAAARRAAQAAAADAEKGKSPRRPETSAGVAAKAPGSARVKAMLDRLRRPLLVSAAALVLAIGGYRLLTDTAPEQPSQVASIAPAGAPEPAAPTVTVARGPNGVAPGAQTDVPDPQTTQAVEPRREERPANQASAPGPGFDSPGPAAPRAVSAGSDAPGAEASQKQASQLPLAPANPPSAKPAAGPADATPNSALASLKQAALAGDGPAMYELGVRTMEGRGVPRDPRAAVTLFEKAGEKNIAPAQYRAGNAYEKGIGVTRDIEAARRWYLRAAESGNTRAMHNLAVLMAEGASGKPDYGNAIGWFQRAAEQGVRDSQFNLAVLFARGLGTPQDLVRSYTWFAIAAAQGDEEAARKRDEVAARLPAAELARAKSAAERWRVTPPNPAANELAPAGASTSSEAAPKQRSAALKPSSRFVQVR